MGPGAQPQVRRAELTPQLIDQAVRWVNEQKLHVANLGEPLRLDWHHLARRAGVAHLGQVRILEVEAMPHPTEQPLAEFIARSQIMEPGRIQGLTAGHSILIVKGYMSAWLVSHELRHVQQYEALGGVEGFIPRYLNEIAEFGYSDAPLEVDARAYEFHEGPRS